MVPQSAPVRHSVNNVLEKATVSVEWAEMALSGMDAKAVEDVIGISAEEMVDFDAASDSVE